MTDRDAVGRLMWHMGSDRGCSGGVWFVSVTIYKVLEFCSTVTLSDRNKDHPSILISEDMTG